MKDKKKNTLEIKCNFCKIYGRIDFKGWKVRITGAMEIACPSCGKVSVYIGKFGQDLELAQLAEDIERHGTDEQRRPSMGSETEPGREADHDFPNG